MVELRKRKPRDEPPAPPPKRKSNPVKAAVDKAKAVVAGKGATGKTDTSASKAGGTPTVGSTVSLDSFGGEIETHEGEKTTLKALVEASKAGVVLFTYPKASTPGCKLALSHPSGSDSCVVFFALAPPSILMPSAPGEC